MRGLVLGFAVEKTKTDGSLGHWRIKQINWIPRRSKGPALSHSPKAVKHLSQPECVGEEIFNQRLSLAHAFGL